MTDRQSEKLLIEAYDGALFDLDGVVYLGPVAVDGAVEGIARLRERGTSVGFVTNNAARSPDEVARHLTELGIDAAPGDVVTSAQAAARLVLQRFGSGTKTLVVGGSGVAVAVAEAGLTAVYSADDGPAAVIQGYGFDLAWQELNEAAVAINRGAHWVATNTDPTRPTDRGLVPGNGAAVVAVRTAVDRDPEVAGKPYRPLIDDTMRRLALNRPIFVGDRLDTDIAGAVNAGLDSMLVLSGSHGVADLLAAPPGQRPTHLGQTLQALLDPALTLAPVIGGHRCGSVTAYLTGNELVIEGPGTPVEAAWASAHTWWAALDQGTEVSHESALAAWRRHSATGATAHTH